MWNSSGFSSRMTTLSPQCNLNTLHTAAARAVNLKLKSDPDTDCLNPSCGLRTSCLSSAFDLRTRIKLNLQREIKVAIPEAERWFQRLSQVNHGIWRFLKEGRWPSSYVVLLTSYEDGRWPAQLLCSLYFSQPPIGNVPIFPFQEDKAIELYPTFPRNTGGKKSSISAQMLFPIVGETITPTQAPSQSGLLWDITRPSGWLQSDFWQESD